MFDLLTNGVGSHLHLKLGWFAVRNRGTEEILEGESFDVRDRKEQEFFEGGKWKTATMNFPALGSLDPKVLGIRLLKRSLQVHLYKRVKENFPRLRAKMKSLEIEYNMKIQGMGEPRDNPRDQRVYLSEIQTVYEAEVARSLHGDYRVAQPEDHASRLRYHIRRHNDAFESEMRNNAVKYTWQLDDRDNVSEGIFRWIEKTWRAHRGSEPRHDAPRSHKIKACNDDLYMFACEDDALRFKIREKLERREIQAFEDARTELQHILNDCDFIDSWSPQLEIFFEQGQLPRIERQVALQLEQKASDVAQTTSEQVSSQEAFHTKNRIYEVHDWLFAYWKVAYPRFVDNVIIQVVERHLLGRKGPLKLFDRNWIFGLEDEELADLVGENEETMSARKELKERLDGLRSALAKADTALRSRA
jgi:hypothetical protein